MKQLTKKQRHEVYKKALSLMATNRGVCHAIMEVIGRDPKKEDMIEVRLFKNPKMDLGTYWLSSPLAESYTKAGKEFRELVLMFCIEMTRP